MKRAYPLSTLRVRWRQMSNLIQWSKSCTAFHPEDFNKLKELGKLAEQLQARAVELERYRDLAELYLDIYNCKKCNSLVNRGYICFACGDSNPSEYKGVEGD